MRRTRTGGKVLAAVLVLALPAVALPAAPRCAVLMVDDFDGEPNTMNNLFGSRARLASGAMVLETQTLSGRALRHVYSITSADGGWTTQLGGQNSSRGRDISDAIAVRFQIRGVDSTTRIRVGLRDTTGASATAEVTGITSAWQERSVELPGAFAGLDLTRIARLDFIVPRDYADDPDLTGSLYFDNIYFETAVAEPTDDAGLLLEMARRNFRYFWDLANATTGLCPDRATNESAASVAGVGYQLAALPIGVEHGWAPRAAAAARARLILQTLATAPQRPDGSVANENAYSGRWGFFYHFLDSSTGVRTGTCELSSIDSTLCYLGVINALVYFDGTSTDETELRGYANTILTRVNWPLMYSSGANMVWMEWKPDTGYGGYWDTYTDETMLITLLAIASPTYPLPTSVFYAWKREQRHYENYAAYASLTGTMFTYYQAHGWLDLRGRTDRHSKTPANWLNNSWMAARAAREFCIDKQATYSTYGPDAWGLSDSCAPGTSYFSPLSQPRLSTAADSDNGTIPPSGAGSTLTFFRDDPGGNAAVDALRHYYADFDEPTGLPRLWKPYGLVDAFNTSGTTFWYGNECICLAQGATLLAIENYLADNAVGRRTASYSPLATALNTVMLPAGDLGHIAVAREAEQYTWNSGGAGIALEYHPEASGNQTLQLGSAAGNFVEYTVRSYWTPGAVYRLEMKYSEDVAGNVLAVNWDGIEIGRFTTVDSGGWLTFISSPSFTIGRIDAGDHLLRVINTNGGTYGVNLDVIRVYTQYRAGDLDTDGDIDQGDYGLWADCLAGPGVLAPPPLCPAAQFQGADLDGDGDVDLQDFAVFAAAVGG